MNLNEQKQDRKKKQDELEAIEDSMQLIEESFGEGLKIALGELMIDVDEDGAKEYHEKVQEQKKEEMDKIDENIDEIEGKMKDLKIQLYAKFGSQINLD